MLELINNNAVVINVVILMVYTLATIWILITNKKQIKKSIDIGLYDKRMEVVKNIEKKDFSNTFSEIEILFDKDIYSGIKKLQDLVNKENSARSDKDRYYSLCDSYGINDPTEYPDTIPGCCDEECDYNIEEINADIEECRKETKKQYKLIMRRLVDFTKNTITK